jgi:ribosome biogenesis SPOUT family RNA methylase Rps3
MILCSVGMCRLCHTLHPLRQGLLDLAGEDGVVPATAVHQTLVMVGGVMEDRVSG